MPQAQTQSTLGRIAVSVYRPTRNGQPVTEPLPVIVTQMRSQTDSPRSTEMMRYFTDRGYVWVAQDRRGTGASFGRHTAPAMSMCAHSTPSSTNRCRNCGVSSAHAVSMCRC